MTAVAIIVTIFFVIGVLVGVITVIAMSAQRRYQRPDAGNTPDRRPRGPDDPFRDGAPDDPPSWWKSREGD